VHAGLDTDSKPDLEAEMTQCGVVPPPDDDGNYGAHFLDNNYVYDSLSLNRTIEICIEFDNVNRENNTDKKGYFWEVKQAQNI